MEIYGSGGVGGKASGLISMEERLREGGDGFPMEVTVPRFSVIGADSFRDFVKRNDLKRYSCSDDPDDRIAMAFIRGEVSPMLAGSLWKYIREVHLPVAVRSSSMLEDDLRTPLAGIYQTKMIPNNQPSDEIRFRKLMEAVKLVWASTYFGDSREFHRGMGTPLHEEAMAVVLQDIVGRRYGDRFYPAVSGVTRTYNFYAFGKSRPEDGVVSLALGLGKTIVDGGMCWAYSPRSPRTPPPFGSAGDMMKNTQNSFWCVNMEKPKEFDPVRETEYMLSCSLKEADYDDTLRLVASTYLPDSDMMVSGTGRDGPRVVNFAPILKDGVIPLNDTLLKVMEACEDAAGSPVEVEFAMAGPQRGIEPCLGILQVRSISAGGDSVDIPAEEMEGPNTVAVSRRALGNGETTVKHVVYVKPESFSTSITRAIALEIAAANRTMRDQGLEYLLIGFGRWGSTDPWLGIPVTWGHISGARAVLEISGPRMRVELSQGSHFFHNLSSFGVSYLSVNETLDGPVRWDLIEAGSETVHDSGHVRCVRVPEGLRIRIDGRKGLGVIVK
jgi:hypothetical protein